MSERAGLKETFFQDAEAFLEELDECFANIEQNPTNQDALNRAFRIAHSLKSESAFLDMEMFARYAHGLEDVLQAIRENRIIPSREAMNVLFAALDRLRAAYRKLEANEASDGILDQDLLATLATLSRNENKILPMAPPVFSIESVEFSDFEKQLLTEAEEQGETLYRLVAEIDASAPMKYPRAYLLVNNLEIIANVIKTIPPIGFADDRAFERVIVYFTSGARDRDIYKAINVDQIKRTHLAALDYGDYKHGRGEVEVAAVQGTFPHALPSKRSIRLAVHHMDELLGYLSELKLSIHDVEEGLNRLVAEDEAKVELEALRQRTKDVFFLAGSMERVLKEVRRIPLSSVLGPLPRLVRDLAEQAEKDVELVITGGDRSLDRSIVEALSDPIVHLVRNAVDHGVETKRERELAGKPQKAVIEVKVEERDAAVYIHVIDDGKGIDPKTVVAKAVELGILKTENPDTWEGDVLELLSAPGFTTQPLVTDVSGRGVGLDLVKQKVRETLGGSLELVTVPGKGSTFTLAIPARQNLLSFLMVRCDEYTLAVPRNNVVQSFPVSQADLSVREDGVFYKDEYPVFVYSGRLKNLEDAGTESFGILLSYVDRKGCFLASELLFEKEIPEALFEIGSEIVPHIYRSSFRNEGKDVLFLHPSIVR